MHILLNSVATDSYFTVALWSLGWCVNVSLNLAPLTNTPSNPGTQRNMYSIPCFVFPCSYQSHAHHRPHTGEGNRTFLFRVLIKRISATATMVAVCWFVRRYIWSSDRNSGRDWLNLIKNFHHHHMCTIDLHAQRCKRTVFYMLSSGNEVHFGK